MSNVLHERTLDLEELRRVYELGADSIPAILERFGLKVSQLRKLREDGNWTTRPRVAVPGALQGHKPVGEEALELRLNRLVAIGTAMLERKIADEGMTEANARTLKELCHAQEIRMRSTRNEKAAKAREKKNNDDGADFRDDPNWLRAEFARRLDQIFGPDSVGGGVRGDGAAGATGGAHDVALSVSGGTT